MNVESRPWAGRRRRVVVAWLAIGLLGTVVSTGCDLGLDQKASRHEQLNDELKELIAILKQVSDEESANEHAAALKEVATKIVKLQDEIAERQAKSKSGMGQLTSHRQTTFWQQIGDNARRKTEKIRKADEKAGAIVDDALTGVIFPDSPGVYY